MKADGIGNKIYDDSIVSTYTPKPVKRIKLLIAPALSDRSGNVELATSIERADKIAASVGQKLHEMAVLLRRMGNEKSDIIREQLAHYFNVLRAFIEEALHPTGDASTDRFLSGESFDVPSLGVSGAIQGEKISPRTKLLDISELPKNMKNTDIDFASNAIGRAQGDVHTLRSNLAKARAQIAHLSHGSSEITL
jgi:hypothetical protein